MENAPVIWTANKNNPQEQMISPKSIKKDKKKFRVDNIKTEGVPNEENSIDDMSPGKFSISKVERPHIDFHAEADDLGNFSCEKRNLAPSKEFVDIQKGPKGAVYDLELQNNPIEVEARVNNFSELSKSPISVTDISKIDSPDQEESLNTN